MTLIKYPNTTLISSSFSAEPSSQTSLISPSPSFPISLTPLIPDTYKPIKTNKKPYAPVKDNKLKTKSNCIRILKFDKNSSQSKTVKSISKQWSDFLFELKSKAKEKGMDALSEQLDLASNVAGEIAEYDSLDDATFFVASTNGRLQGIAITSDQDYLDWIVVAPHNIKNVKEINESSTFLSSERVLGIGSLLVKNIVEYNKKTWGSKSLTTNSADLSIGFYKTLGFENAGDKDMPNLMTYSVST